MFAGMADEATWAKRVAGWRASGQTAAEFAAGRGYAGSTLRWWASRLGRERRAFVRVVAKPADAPSGDGALEVEVGGVRVHVRAGFDRVALVALLEVLRAGGAT